VQTRLAGRVAVREDNAAGALEVMSRFAIEPRWLLYLPPTMAPTATTPDGDLLEHPDTAFDFYRRSGVEQLVCEEKHMGSRAVVLVCRSAQVAADRFGAGDGATGAVHTRTGRSFFPAELTEQLLQAVRTAVDGAGLWDELDTDWLLLDAELLPWSAKAEDLLRHQYAAVGLPRVRRCPRLSQRCTRRRHGASTSRTCSPGPPPGPATRRRSPTATGATSGRRRAGRRAAGALPAAGDRGPDLDRPGPRLAPRAWPTVSSRRRRR
jgi:hypothetical protein